MQTKMIMAGTMLSLLVVSSLFANDNVRDRQATRRALLVGINEYDPAYGPGKLPSCINDALGVRNTIMLADPGQRWPASSIQVLTNNLATCSAIRTALQTLAAASQPGDVALYAHSSHGGQYSGTSVYLCAYDEDFTAVALGQDLSSFNSGVTVIVLVDACYSGGLFKQKDGWPFAEMAMQSYMQAKAKQYQTKGLAVPKDLGNNIAFMTACDYSQTCWAGSPYSLYIGTVITGCQDSAVDANHDGLYQFSELHTHAAQLASQANPNQTAQMFHEAVLTSMVARSVSPVVPSTPVTGDIDGDQKADLISVVGSNWYVWFSLSEYAQRSGPFDLGVAGTPLTGDIDGDRKADLISVVGPNWYVWFSSAEYATCSGPFDLGIAGAPATGDIDGDQKADLISVVGPNWYVWFSSAEYAICSGPFDLGIAGAPATGDIDGDRKADLISVVGPNWYVWFSSAEYATCSGPFDLGIAGAPLTGDIDGDRLADLISVEGSNWYVWFSTAQYQTCCGPYALIAP